MKRLTSVLLAFTLYLTVARVIAGAADGAAVKLAKAAISGAVPVWAASSPTPRRRCWPVRGC